MQSTSGWAVNNEIWLLIYGIKIETVLREIKVVLSFSLNLLLSKNNGYLFNNYCRRRRYGALSIHKSLAYSACYFYFSVYYLGANYFILAAEIPLSSLAGFVGFRPVGDILFYGRYFIYYQFRRAVSKRSGSLPPKLNRHHYRYFGPAWTAWNYAGQKLYRKLSAGNAVVWLAQKLWREIIFCFV